MTSAEISASDLDNREPYAIAAWLREIAHQLAVMNEQIEHVSQQRKAKEAAFAPRLIGLDDIGLSTRARNALFHADISSIANDATVLLDVNPRRIKNYGRVCFVDTVGCLLRAGIPMEDLQASMFWRRANRKWRSACQQKAEETAA